MPLASYGSAPSVTNRVDKGLIFYHLWANLKTTFKAVFAQFHFVAKIGISFLLSKYFYCFCVAIIFRHFK